METEIEEVVSEQVQLLPAANNVVLLPGNWQTQEAFVYRESTSSVRKVFQNSGVPTEVLGYGKGARTTHNRSSEWIGPAIFLPLAYLSENKDAIAVSLNLLSNYLSGLFKGSRSEPDVTIEFLIEKRRGVVTRASYKGPVSGLLEFRKSLEALE